MPTPFRYTLQLFSDSGYFGCPAGNEVIHLRSLRQAEAAVSAWADAHSKVGADPVEAYALCWLGELADTTDQYPDFELRLSPRGAVVRRRV